MRNIRTGALVLAIAAVPVLGAETAALAKTATKTEIYGSEVNNGKESVSAALTKGSNDYGVSGKKLVFKYYKKVGGSWQFQAKDRQTTSGLGLATGTFKAEKNGTCKVTAKFRGTDKLAPSKDAWVIDCATGAQK